MEKVEQSIKEFISETIRTIPDFPKKGIMFKDITTLLNDRRALVLTSYMLSQPYIDYKVDHIVGLESRGFLFGTNLAQDLNAGFIPIRKPGKLPHDVLKQNYELEYGTDSVEVHVDAFKKGDRIIIHDDLIATGGTAAAATELVERLGGVVVGYSFVMELRALKGKEKLKKDVPFETIVEI
ncbi:adenine phosphoribosyltransferase [Balneola sp. MJW-20]|uniref:adenine phosphoribosyltransferase n=1 Tax=Gracilimonas aurantiaca TaxID=3234185 RepID=UPI003466AEC2